MNPAPLYLTPDEIRLNQKYGQYDPDFEARKSLKQLNAEAEIAEDAAEWEALGATQIIDEHELTRGTNGKG